MKRVLDQEYIDKILGPAGDVIMELIAASYEQLESMSNDPSYYRGKIAGLKQAYDTLRVTAKNIYTEEDEE